MTAIEDTTGTVFCARHPSRPTALRCGKCNIPICTRCVVQTPVGGRCAACANLRRLPQFEVGLWLIGRSFAGGLIVSLVGWFFLSYVPYLRYFLSILVGVAVGESMSGLARRRTNRVLEIAAVFAVVVGLFGVEMARTGLGFGIFQAMSNEPGIGTSLLIPGAIASFVTVVKLRS